MCNMDKWSQVTLQPRVNLRGRTKIDWLGTHGGRWRSGHCTSGRNEKEQETRGFVWCLDLKADSVFLLLLLLLLWNTMTEEDCQCSRWNGEKGEADEHQSEIKDEEFKKLENKGGANETHQHDRANRGWKILEISDLIVFNLFSGRAGVSPEQRSLSAVPMRQPVLADAQILGFFFNL